MYEGMDYSVFRRVREYYGRLGFDKGGKDQEDAYGQSSRIQKARFLVESHLSHPSSAHLDMRKPLSRDPGRKSVRPNGREIIITRDQAP